MGHIALAIWNIPRKDNNNGTHCFSNLVI